MSRPPTPNAPDAAASPAQAGAEEPCHLDARYCPRELPFARGDLQQDIIDMLTPVDDDRLKEGMPDTEFNRKYPPDTWCEEAAPNARVWKICRDEATASDRDMLESWNKTLDVLLIFAGLFSAVSTAFIIESYKTLQPDYSQYVATFLYSAAVAYNRSGSALPPLDAIPSPEGSFHSTTIERWINGLWFISLTISLLVALLCILIKQWLDEYRARVSRSAPDHAYWARRHALYHDGLQSWGVPVIISCLPLLLHVSLFLFLAGLVLFLRLLDAAIARAVLVVLVLLLGLYLLSMALPAFYIECPSKTQVLTHALHAWLAFVASLGRLARRVPTSWLSQVATFLDLRAHTHDKKEAQQLSDAWDELDTSALARLTVSINDPDVLTVVADAWGDVSAYSLDLLRHKSPEAYNRVRRSLNQVLYSGLATHTPTGGFEVACYARSRRTQIAFENVYDDPSYPTRSRVLGSPDLRLALGIEGALLGVLDEWEPTFTVTCGIRNLVAALRTMNWIPASQYPGALDHYLPRRSSSCLRLPFCLLFLETTAHIAELCGEEGGKRPLSYSPHFYSLAMLVFCAARFASRPSSYEEQTASQCLITIVHTRGGDSHNSTSTTNGSIEVNDDGIDERRIRSRGIDALYTMLAHMDEYNIHPDVANIVAPYALSLSMDGYAACALSLSMDGRPPYALALSMDSFSSWADRQGLSDLILSDGFEQHTTSAEELARYTKAIAFITLDNVACGPQRTKELLMCTSVLASRAASLNFSPSQYYEVIRGTLSGIFAHLYNNPREENEAVILSHFLSDTTVLERWMEIFWHCSEVLLPSPTLVLQERTMLASVLAYTLRRRSRVKLEVKPEWTHTLFSNQVAVRIAESALRNGAAEDSDGFFERNLRSMKSFLRHWRHLSPSSWSALCDHLHTRESGIPAADIERFRNGLLPRDVDGAAAIDCDSYCYCLRPYEGAPSDQLAEATHLSADGGWRDRWGHRIQHWRPWTKRTPTTNAGREVPDLSAEV